MSYQYIQNSKQQVEVLVATGGEKVDLHLLMPAKDKVPTSVMVDGVAAQCKVNVVGGSNYVDFYC